MLLEGESKEESGVYTECLIRLFQGELVYLALNLLQLGKLDGFLRVHDRATRPYLDRQSIKELWFC